MDQHQQQDFVKSTQSNPTDYAQAHQFTQGSFKYGMAKHPAIEKAEEAASQASQMAQNVTSLIQRQSSYQSQQLQINKDQYQQYANNKLFKSPPKQGQFTFQSPSHNVSVNQYENQNIVRSGGGEIQAQSSNITGRLRDQSNSMRGVGQQIVGINLNSSRIDPRDELHNIPYEMQPKNRAYVGQQLMGLQDLQRPIYDSNKDYGLLRAPNHQSSGVGQQSSQKLDTSQIDEYLMKDQPTQQNLPLYLQKLKVGNMDIYKKDEVRDRSIVIPQMPQGIERNYEVTLKKHTQVNSPSPLQYYSNNGDELRSQRSNHNTPNYKQSHPKDNSYHARIEDNPGADQDFGDMEESLPSDLSIDLDHQADDGSDVSDYDEERERRLYQQQQNNRDRSQNPSSRREVQPMEQQLKRRESSVSKVSSHKHGGNALTLDKLDNLADFSPLDKVHHFLQNNPLCQTFIRKEKGRLPYSVFKPHAEEVYFLKSIFDKRPPTAFFPYPRYTKVSRDSERVRKYHRNEVEYLFMAFRINDSTHIYNAVVNSFKNAGFQLIENSPYWNVLWTGYTKYEDIRELNKYQKVNHFPGSIQLGRKDLLWKNMYRLKTKFGREYDITPMTYLFPEDYNRFQVDREAEENNVLYILKPVASSCGRGIKVIGKKTKINRRDGYLASKYICKPHLINGFKYDLRVYVLVSSYDPLRIYVYNDGLVRFATEKYTLNPQDLKKRFIHLTNFSVNKKSENFKQNKADGEGEENSSKWSFKALRKAYEQKQISFDYVFAQVKDVIVKTLISVEPHVVSNLNKAPGNRSSCFELYGFDVLIDKNLKPWLLEVNVLPSLSSSSPFDKNIKTMLICDVLTLIGIRGYDKKKVHSGPDEDKKQLKELKSMNLDDIIDQKVFTGDENLTSDELSMLMDHEEEFSRKGNFSRVFPLAANVDYYEKFFEVPRYYNNLLWAYIRGGQKSQTIIIIKFMANKSSIITDLMGVLRGVYIIHSHSASLPAQRRPVQQRHLTDAQRLELNQRHWEEDHHHEMNQVIPIQKEEVSVAKVSQIDTTKTKAVAIPETVVDQKVEVEVRQTAQVVKPEPAKVIIPPKVQATQESAKIKEPAQEDPHHKEFGESSFGKSLQQNTQTVDDSDTPFFMKQDRPKFSAQERYVPASSASRAFQFGLLGVQLIGGTVKEAFKQKLVIMILFIYQGFGEESADQQKLTGIKKYAVNANNADRLQKTFRKMRGAVLKLGQILSTSEESVVPPVIRDAMERARSEADIMPVKQVMKILDKELGNEWQKKFREINLYPFAAASIGQVHEAILKNGQRVAMKMQYTGVGDSIDSDLNNFKRLITLFGAPRGLYLNELIETTRTELYWETDYLREAEYQRNYGEKVKPYPEEYYCPKVIDDLTTKHVLCTEFIDGVEIDTLINESQSVRNRAGSLMLKLCFKELFEWKIMQTDPNPANYLYDLNRQRLHLLDFGSGRDFSHSFLDGYMRIIHGAYTQNRDQIMDASLKLGFLTGEENKEMLTAHYQGALAIGEPFRYSGGLYDFGNQQITKNIYEIVPAMSKHRLTPPPKEIYSLHRKIMGTYLMCIKLRAKVPAQKIFEDTYDAWLKTLKKI